MDNNVYLNLQTRDSDFVYYNWKSPTIDDKNAGKGYKVKDLTSLQNKNILLTEREIQQNEVETYKAEGIELSFLLILVFSVILLVVFSVILLVLLLAVFFRVIPRILIGTIGTIGTIDW